MKTKNIYFWLLFGFVIFTYSKAQPNTMPLQHGKALTDQHIDINQYYISEKLDGVRGYWDGLHLYTRQGNIINVPESFTKNWPNTALDGELWSKRNHFDHISGCVRRNKAQACWQSINFHIFDLPKHQGSFHERVVVMDSLCQTLRQTTIQCVQQLKLRNTTELNHLLDQVIAQQGEGLMLHHQDALYQAKRVNHLLKLKPSYVDTATVVGHVEGKGKYKGMLGSLTIETKTGIRFKIGTGFTDEQRRNPPVVGSKIEYKYLGKTAKGVPRFASFIKEINQGN